MTAPRSLLAAHAFLGAQVEPPVDRETVPLAAALGRVLAGDVMAPLALPPFDNAAMDGFALREADLTGSGPHRFPVSQVIAAGKRDVAPLAPGTTARIMTGAPIPPGADRVVMQEHAVLRADTVQIVPPRHARPHIRQRGEDLAEGAVALTAGTRIGAGQLALLAGLGVTELVVWRRPRVALLSTGDELGDGGQRAAGQIHDSNRPMLLALLQASGAEVTDLGILPDVPETILHNLIAAAADHDLLVSSGGASAGFADHLAAAVVQRGCLEFWQLDMRPGKPIGFGDIDHCPLLMLPGNPFAAATGFATLGRVLLDRLSGVALRPLAPLRLPIAGSFEKPAGRTHVLAGRLVQTAAGATRAQPLARQGSASLMALAGCDCLIVLGAGQTSITPGDIVDILPMSPVF